MLPLTKADARADADALVAAFLSEHAITRPTPEQEIFYAKGAQKDREAITRAATERRSARAGHARHQVEDLGIGPIDRDTDARAHHLHQNPMSNLERLGAPKA